MTVISQSVRYTAPESAFTLPPELQELKLLAREIVDRECIPLEGEPESGPCIRCGHPRKKSVMSAAGAGRCSR